MTVGFSYTTDEKDKEFGDAQAAEDNYQVIQQFLQRFPHLRDRDLHLSGESYAGYVQLYGRGREGEGGGGRRSINR